MRISMLSVTIPVGWIAALAVSCASGSSQRPGGLGEAKAVVPASAPVSHRLDLQSIATQNAGYTNPGGPNGGLGVVRTPNGHWFASFRRDVPGTPHFLFEFDAEGAWVAAHPQPAITMGSDWGIRDLAWDGQVGASSRLYGGFENAISGGRILAFDWTNGQWDPVADVVQTETRLSVTRGLAFVPRSSAFPLAPAGVLVCADFFGQVEFVNVATGGLAGPRVASAQPAVTGIAYDPVRETLWFGGQLGSQRSNATRVVFTETDLFGQPTERRFLGDLTVPFVDENSNSFPGGLCGGVEFFTDAQGPAIAYLAQASSDTLVTVHGRFEYGVGCGSSKIGFSGEAYAGNPNFKIVLDKVPAGTTGVFVWLGLTVPPPGLTLLPNFVNCTLLLDATRGLRPLPGPLPVDAAGRAELAFPQTAAAAGLSIAFQFLVPTPVTIAPIDMSEGGSIYFNLNP